MDLNDFGLCKQVTSGLPRPRKATRDHTPCFINKFNKLQQIHSMQHFKSF